MKEGVRDENPSPFDEIRPHAERAASKFLMYLDRNIGTFSLPECEQLSAVLLSFDTLVPELRSHPETENLRRLFAVFETMDAQRPFTVRTIHETFGGDEERCINLSPFGLASIDSDAAAHFICRFLKKRQGQLSLNECLQISRIWAHFENLLVPGALGNASQLPSIEALKGLLYPDGLIHEDACRILIRQYGSEEAQSDYFEPIALQSLEEAPPQPHPMPANDTPFDLGSAVRAVGMRFSTRLRALLTWQF